MPLTIGVEITEISSKTNAMKRRTVKGVAGRNIVASFLMLPVVTSTWKCVLCWAVLEGMACGFATRRVGLGGTRQPVSVTSAIPFASISRVSRRQWQSAMDIDGLVAIHATGGQHKVGNSWQQLDFSRVVSSNARLAWKGKTSRS